MPSSFFTWMAINHEIPIWPPIALAIFYHSAADMGKNCAFDDKSMKLGTQWRQSISLQNILAIGIFQITPRVKMAAIFQNSCQKICAARYLCFNYSYSFKIQVKCTFVRSRNAMKQFSEMKHWYFVLVFINEAKNRNFAQNYGKLHRSWDTWKKKVPLMTEAWNLAHC